MQFFSFNSIVTIDNEKARLDKKLDLYIEEETKDIKMNKVGIATGIGTMLVGLLTISTGPVGLCVGTPIYFVGAGLAIKNGAQGDARLQSLKRLVDYLDLDEETGVHFTHYNEKYQAVLDELGIVQKSKSEPLKLKDQ